MADARSRLAKSRCSTPTSKVVLRSGSRSGLPWAKKDSPYDSKKLGSLMPIPALARSVVASSPSRARTATAARGTTCVPKLSFLSTPRAER